MTGPGVRPVMRNGLIELTTHAIGGLSGNDVVPAARIDRLRRSLSPVARRGVRLPLLLLRGRPLLREMDPEAFRAEAVGELHVGVPAEVVLELAPVSLLVPDILAIHADR